MNNIKKILIFISTSIVVIFICELFIRYSHLGSVSSTEFYSDIGRGRRSDLEFTYFNEGFGIGKFNEFRYIGNSRPYKKPLNTIRIALVGDSFVESFQIFERNYFGTIAENILNSQHPNKKIEILNFGRSGFDISNMYTYQKTFVDKFDPDYVLYFVSNSDLTPKQTDQLRPQVAMIKDSLFISYDYPESEVNLFQSTKFFTQNSSILNMLNNGRKKASTTPVLSILLEDVYYWFPQTKNLNKIEKNEKFNLDKITVCIIKNLDFNKIIMVNRDTIELPSSFQKECISNNLKIIDLSKFINSQPNDLYFWTITKKRGHWNNSAHKLIGKELARELNLEILKKSTFQSVD